MFKAALEANERVILPSVGLFADGTAVAQIGEKPFDVIRLQSRTIQARSWNRM